MIDYQVWAREIREKIATYDFRRNSWIRLNRAHIIYQDGDSILFSREGHTGRAEPSPVTH